MYTSTYILSNKKMFHDLPTSPNNDNNMSILQVCTKDQVLNDIYPPPPTLNILFLINYFLYLL